MKILYVILFLAIMVKCSEAGFVSPMNFEPGQEAQGTTKQELTR